MIESFESKFIDTMMTTIVFYDIDNRLTALSAKTLIADVCELLGETPSNMHVGLNEDGSKSRSPKWSAVDKEIARGNFSDYKYFTAVSYFEKGNVRDCRIAVGVTESPVGRRISIQFNRDRDRLVDFRDILVAVLQSASPEYGIEYDLTLREGAPWFATGVISSGMPDALARAASEFRQEYFFGKRFKEGFFRDVFKRNYLSQAHLEKVICGVRFADWIVEPQESIGWLGEPSSRGRLSYLDNGCAIWELTNDAAAIVRPIMLRAGLLMVKS